MIVIGETESDHPLGGRKVSPYKNLDHSFFREVLMESLICSTSIIMSLSNEFDLAGMQRIVEKISIPRLLGSPNEAVTIKILSEEFANVELPLKQEPIQATKFWTTTIMQLGMLLAIIMMGIMSWLSIIAPLWNLLIIIVLGVIVFFALRATGGGELKIVGKNFTTPNLVHEIKAPNPKGTIILMAHHDSKSQVITTFQRTVCFTFGVLGLLIAFLGFLFQAILTIMNNPVKSAFAIIGYVGAILVWIFAFPLMINTSTNKSPGALDNASGCAAVWALGKYFKTHSLQNWNVLLLITAAEEYGMLGARAYVKNHLSELKAHPTYVLNFDMIGHKGEKVEVIEIAGFPVKKPVSVLLNGYAHKVAETANIPFRGFYLPIGASTDRYVFSRVGIEGTDFINRKAALSTHSAGDNITKFDVQLAGQFITVAMGIMHKIEKEL